MIIGDFPLFVEKEQFYHSYQSICTLKDKNVIGNEILLRAEIGPPDLIFEQAIVSNKLYELDTRSIYKALCTTTSLRKNGLLFLNIYPTTLTSSEFPHFIDRILKEFPNCNHKIIFELNETERAEPILFIERVQLLKELGFLIAIDDVGKGWSTLRRIIEIEPHYLKLDNYFSESLAASKKKQLMIKAILSFCELNDIKIILEGIETEEDLMAARELGVNYGQGYFLGRPQMLKES